MSVAQTITVTDPPPTLGEKIALLSQYMASFATSGYGHGEALVTNPSPTDSARSGFLASPHS
jgi:hypothetical protein